MIAILGVYLFIVIGFIAKKVFKEIEAKSFVLAALFDLYPKKVAFLIVITSLIYLGIMLVLF